MKTCVVLGPPGTGKTHRLLQEIEAELSNGLSPLRLGFVTFTRAARVEALDRIATKLGLRWGQLPWVSTIHSCCYRLLGLKKTAVMGPKNWNDFADRYHYDLSGNRQCGDLDDPLAGGSATAKTDDDRIRELTEWCAVRCLDLDDGAASYPERVDVRQAQVFAARIASYKAEHGLFTFTDMIRAALDRALVPPVDVLFVDEAQDLAPIQIEAVEAWRAHVSRCYVAGDDDQAIYAFQGAEPSWLIEQSLVADRRVILDRSYRIPASVHRVACSIIERNTARIPKIYRPRGEEGSIDIVNADEVLPIVPPEGSVFILARNRKLLAPWRSRLIVAGAPFENSPLERPSVQASLAASEALRSKGAVSKGDLVAWLKMIPLGEYAPRGVKARAGRLDDDARLTISELVEEPWNLVDLVDLALTDPITLLMKGTTGIDRDYIRRVIGSHGGIPKPRFVLSTIHGAKGREADTVVVLSDMLGMSYRGLMGLESESEHRVAYVAVSRARHRLIIVRPNSRRHFDYSEHLRAAALSRSTSSFLDRVQGALDLGREIERDIMTKNFEQTFERW